MAARRPLTRCPSFTISTVEIIHQGQPVYVPRQGTAVMMFAPHP